MSDFLNRMKETARADKKTIVLVEGEDRRVVMAARRIIAEDIANIVILGDVNALDVEGATIIDPATSDKRESYARAFAEIRASKGMTYELAYDEVADATVFGTMMVKMGDADGLVSGACHSTANTLRPALQILKTAPGTKLVSGFFIMCTPKTEYGEEGTLLFADCGLNINPNAEELAEIAASSAQTWQAFMRDKPYVAMLSYSTMASAGGESAEKVREATQLVKEKYNKLCCIDGDLQLDAALVETVALSKAPDSTVAGHANILIFPDLSAGNIGYKLVQRFAGAEAYGPLLQGISKPVNDLSRGCSVNDIVGVVAITAVQAQQMEKAAAAQ
ncbi:MAG: phosphate acetyltransferase [Atopobiaceae bacterium]|nr:phosphate acetyltransferase [Atopobiaceae bacterium]